MLKGVYQRIHHCRFPPWIAACIDCRLRKWSTVTAHSSQPRFLKCTHSKTEITVALCGTSWISQYLKTCSVFSHFVISVSLRSGLWWLLVISVMSAKNQAPPMQKDDNKMHNLVVSLSHCSSPHITSILWPVCGWSQLQKTAVNCEFSKIQAKDDKPNMTTGNKWCLSLCLINLRCLTWRPTCTMQ